MPRSSKHASSSSRRSSTKCATKKAVLSASNKSDLRYCRPSGSRWTKKDLLKKDAERARKPKCATKKAVLAAPKNSRLVYCSPPNSRLTRSAILKKDKEHARLLKHKAAAMQKPASGRYVSLTDAVLQDGVAKMKAHAKLAAKENRENIAATADLLQEAFDLEREKEEAVARVEQARQHQADLQVAIATAPGSTARLLELDAHAQRAEEFALAEVGEVVAETSEVLKEVAQAQKLVAPAQYTIIDAITTAPPNDRFYVLAKCLTTDTLHVYYRSQSGMLWHLARMAWNGQLEKSRHHYTGGFVASWELQNLLNAAVAKGSREVGAQELTKTAFYEVMRRDITDADKPVWELVENNCLREPHALLKLLNDVFACPLNPLFTQDNAKHDDDEYSYDDGSNRRFNSNRRFKLRPDVKELVHSLFEKTTATKMLKSLLERDAKRTYTFVRDVVDKYMREHFIISPNTSDTEVVSAFDTSYLQNVSVIKRIIESKTDRTARFNVFIAVYQIRNAPDHLRGRVFRQVLLIQNKGYVDDALAKLADSYGVTYCFAPAGQLTCKPFEYTTQTLEVYDIHGNKRKDVMFVGNKSYVFVGEFLSGIFPA